MDLKDKIKWRCSICFSSYLEKVSDEEYLCWYGGHLIKIIGEKIVIHDLESRQFQQDQK